MFYVMRIEKRRRQDVSGIQKENNRTAAEYNNRVDTTQSGLNLPGMYADYKLLGKPIDFNAKVEDAGKVFVNERILLDEYVRGRLSAKEAKELISRAQIFFMKNDEDQPSTRHFKRFGPAATVTRLIRMRRERLAEAADLAAAEGLIDENEMAES